MKFQNFICAAGVAVAVVLVSASSAPAADYRLGALRIEEPWARATAAPQMAGGAFMVIENTGEAPDRLVAASCADTTEAALHETRTEGGIMRMRPIDAVEIPPHGRAELRPSGAHVMLMGRSAALKEGGTLRCALTFERAGATNVVVRILAAGAMGPSVKRSTM